MLFNTTSFSTLSIFWERILQGSRFGWRRIMRSIFDMLILRCLREIQVRLSTAMRIYTSGAQERYCELKGIWNLPGRVWKMRWDKAQGQRKINVLSSGKALKILKREGKYLFFILLTPIISLLIPFFVFAPWLGLSNYSACFWSLKKNWFCTTSN